MVSDVESYAQFLPGFLEARIVERQGNDLTVRQRVGIPGFTVAFTSYAHFDPPEHILIRSYDKPFRSLRHEWFFKALEPERTAVTMSVDFTLAPAFLGGFREALVRQFYVRSVEAFRERAEARRKQKTTGQEESSA